MKKAPINDLARNVSRHVLGGARQADAQKRFRPVAVLTGQQAPGSKEQMARPIQFYRDGKPAYKFTGHESQIDGIFEQVEKSFKTGDYYDLKPDPTLPTWVYHRRSFAIAEKPAPQDVVDLGAACVLHLPAAVLREADYARNGEPPPKADPSISLCSMTQPQDSLQSVVLDPVKKTLWQPATYLRCPLSRAWTKDAPDNSLYELGGIPQEQRWYLDQLKLLNGDDLPKGASIQLLVQFQKKSDGTLSDPIPVQKWIIARRNLTGLQRPGTTMLAKASTPQPLPYMATQDEVVGTLQLLEMASIVNSGGYYFRPGSPIKWDSPTDAAILIVLVLYTQILAADEGESQLLPTPANAIRYSTTSDGADIKADAIRFEGTKHVVIDPCAPPGCVAVGLVRHMGWPPPKPVPNSDDDITSVNGFAESIHLADIEISDEHGIIEQWTRPNALPSPGIALADGGWTSSPCSGDSGSPLFPMKDPDASEQGGRARVGAPSKSRARVVAAAMDIRQAPMAKVRDEPKEHSHYYRSVVRYAYKSVYRRLSAPGTRTLKIAACLRDFQGNRIVPNQQKGCRFQKELFYTDSVIPPAEWPGFEFVVYSSGEGQMTLEVRYHDPTTAEFTSTNIVPENLQTAALLATKSPIDPLSRYLRYRLGSGSGSAGLLALESDQASARHLAAALNSIIEGPCIFDSERFAHVELSEETKLLLLHKPTLRPNELKRLNRLLLDDAYAFTAKPLFTAAGDDNVRLREQYLQKLQLVRDQLAGAEGEIEVTVKDADHNINLVALSVDLRLKLIEYLDRILASNGSPPKGSLQIPFSLTRVVEGPIRFSPEIRITRQAHLPTPDDVYINDETLRQRILSQVTTGASALRFELAPSMKAVDDDDKEFRRIAAQFKLPGCLSALARSRFGGHELWFVPEACIPKPTSSSLEYSTPRPLSNQLGAETFRAPDFTQRATARTPDGDQWQGFKLTPQPRTFTRRDFDDLARSFFGLIESILEPEFVCDPRSKELLAAKDDVAKHLTDNAVVPMFEPSDVSAPNQPGVRRMSLDAFQQDLRTFYRLDTFLGLPVAPRPATTVPANLYGRVDPPFVQSSKASSSRSPVASLPTLSDFVLNVERDWPTSDHGYLTLAYDLPPGQEQHWDEWVMKSVTAHVTHVQLRAPGSAADHPFDQGRWIELAEDNPPAASITWEPSSAVPAITRIFPPEPVLKTTQVSKFSIGRELDASQFDQLSRWTWSIVFEGDYGRDDTVYLDVEYRAVDSDDPTKPNKRKVSASSDGPPFDGLLQHLIVGDALARTFPTWSTTAIKDGIEAATLLLKAIADLIRPTLKLSIASEVDKRIDHFELRPSDLIAHPAAANELITQVDFQKTGAGFEVKAPASAANNNLRLFGSTSATGFNARTIHPQLLLRRNHYLVKGMKTNHVLIYECGPVVFPKRLRISNAFDDVAVKSTSARDPRNPKLRDVLIAVLTAMLGITDLKAYLLRITLKHAFSLKENDASLLVQSNPFKIFPIDYTYGTVEKLAGDIVDAYLEWLKKTGDPSTVLQAANKPRLQVGVQLGIGNLGGELTGHVALQVDAIEIDMHATDLT